MMTGYLVKTGTLLFRARIAVRYSTILLGFGLLLFAVSMFFTFPFQADPKLSSTFSNALYHALSRSIWVFAVMIIVLGMLAGGDYGYLKEPSSAPAARLLARSTACGCTIIILVA